MDILFIHPGKIKPWISTFLGTWPKGYNSSLESQPNTSHGQRNFLFHISFLVSAPYQYHTKSPNTRTFHINGAGHILRYNFFIKWVPFAVSTHVGCCQVIPCINIFHNGTQRPYTTAGEKHHNVLFGSGRASVTVGSPSLHCFIKVNDVMFKILSIDTKQNLSIT